MFRYFRLLPGALLLSSAAAGLAQPRPMTLVDILNMPQISDPQVSPDGRLVLFVESNADWTANRRTAHIWRIRADGSGLAQLTTGADREASPRYGNGMYPSGVRPCCPSVMVDCMNAFTALPTSGSGYLEQTIS